MSEQPKCRAPPSTLDWNKVPLGISLLFGEPLICFMIFRLCTKKLNLNRYHFFIIAQCVDEGILVLLRFIFFLVSLDPCNINKLPYDIINFLSSMCSGFSLVSTPLLSIYWKSIIKTQKCVEKILYAVVIVALLFYCIYYIFLYFTIFIYGMGSPEVNFVYEEGAIPYSELFMFQLPVISTCFISLITVVKLDKSKFSAPTLRSYRKMTTSLFFQALFLTFVVVLGIVVSLLMEPYYSPNSDLANITIELQNPNLNETERSALNAQYVIEQEKFDKVYAFTAFIHFDVPTIVPFFKAVLMWWSVRKLLTKEKPKVLVVSSGGIVNSHTSTTTRKTL